MTPVTLEILLRKYSLEDEPHPERFVKHGDYVVQTLVEQNGIAENLRFDYLTTHQQLYVIRSFRNSFNWDLTKLSDYNQSRIESESLLFFVMKSRGGSIFWIRYNLVAKNEFLFLNARTR